MENLTEIITQGWPAVVALLALLGVFVANALGVLRKGQDSVRGEQGEGGPDQDSGPPSPPRELPPEKSQTKEAYDDAMDKVRSDDGDDVRDISDIVSELRAGQEKRKRNIRRLRGLLDKRGSEDGK